MKDIIKKKNDDMAKKIEEVKALNLRIAELEANGGGGGPALPEDLVKEMKMVKEENKVINARFQEQMEMVSDLVDKVDRYEILLQKNKIPIKK